MFDQPKVTRLMLPGDISVMRLCPDVCVENAAVLSHRDIISILESKTIVSPCFNLQREYVFASYVDRDRALGAETAHSNTTVILYHLCCKNIVVVKVCYTL